MPWKLSSEKSDRRLYVDMLFRKTNMYANYLPSGNLELGDYGVVTRAGEFIRSGNIFKDYPSLKDEVGLRQETSGGSKHFFASRSRRKDTASAITEEIPDLVECSLKLGWNIKKDRHAVLVMIDATHHEIEFEGRLHKFLQNQANLADNAFVTKVYHCSAYAQLITDHGQSGKVHIGFKADMIPTGAESTSVPPTAFDQAWQTFSQTGHWSTGIYHPSPPSYMPLATIRQIRPKEPTLGFRDPIPPAIMDKDEMENYIPPWGELDEEGDEIDPDDDGMEG